MKRNHMLSGLLLGIALLTAGCGFIEFQVGLAVPDPEGVYIGDVVFNEADYQQWYAVAADALGVSTGELYEFQETEGATLADAAWEMGLDLSSSHI